MRNMKRLFLAIIVFLLAAAPSRAQKGLQIDSLFNGSFCPDSTVSITKVIGGNLKSYDLDSFLSAKFNASDSEIARIYSWLLADSHNATDVEMDKEGGTLVYALLTFKENRNTHRFVGYQVKETKSGKAVTIVSMTGKASKEQLMKFFSKRT